MMSQARSLIGAFRPVHDARAPFRLGVWLLMLLVSACQPVWRSSSDTTPGGPDLRISGVSGPIANSTHRATPALWDEARRLQKASAEPRSISYNLGYQRAAVWFYVALDNPGKEAARANLNLGYPLLDEVLLIRAGGSGLPDQESRAGRSTPQHRTRSGEFDFPLLLAPGRTEFLLRVTSEDSISIPLHVRTPAESQSHHVLAAQILGMYYGAILIIALYNFFLFLTLRDRDYLYYVLTLVFLHGYFQLALNGLVSGIPGMGGIWFSREAIVWALAVGLYVAILFGRGFLKTGMYAPLLHSLLGWLRYPVAALPVASVLLPHFIAVQFGVIVGSTGAVVLFLAAAQALRKEYRPALYFVLAWTALLTGAVIYGLKALGIVPATRFAEHAMQGGMAAEALLLSFALGDRFNLLRRQKLQAQRDSLQQERKARQSQGELIDHLRHTERLKDELLALEGDGASMDGLLQKILATLHEILHFHSGFVAVSDRANNVHLHSFPPGGADTALRNMISGDSFVQYLLRVPADLLPYLNFVQILRPDAADVFGAESVLYQRHPAHVAVIRSLLLELRRNQIRIIVPLAFQKEIFGYVLLGDRSSGEAYSTAEVNLLEAFRTSLALAIRNFTLYEELRELKGQADDRVSRLTQYIDDVIPTVRHTVQDRELVYASVPMRTLLESVRKMAEQSLPVLITGETGTGKELIARTLHDSSAEAHGPFVAVNCAAVPSSLWESEIFGHEKGAFTDARSSYAGRVEQAANGTLFFDEIGELPLDIQPKLLRLLQERKYFRLGGREALVARCRFVFATNRQLDDMQRRGLFREDLYYRVSVLEAKLPPLRERRADIAVLALHMIERFARELKTQIERIDDQALDLLRSYDWPGNIRELENVLIQAVLHSEQGVITPTALPAQVRQSAAAPATRSVATSANGPLPNFDQALRDLSRELILRALGEADGNKQEAARLLGIKRATFYYRLKEIGLDNQ